MTTANFVLMFGILALALLTIRAILMKTGSAKCRRKRSNESLADIHQRILTTVGAPSSRRASQTTGGGHVIIPERHLPESSIFMLSLPSYDSNHLYPSVAPPPYTPGDPAPVFVESHNQSSKVFMADSLVGLSPPPYHTIQNPYKSSCSHSAQRETLVRHKSNETQRIESTQL